MRDNLRDERPSFVSHLECSLTGKRYAADQIWGLSEAGKPLLVRYDLPALGRALAKRDLPERAPDMWRYREFLPVRRARDIVALGEVVTPLIPAPREAKRLGGGDIIVKDEGRLPTGSFKSRGLAAAVSMAKALGLERVAMPTAGNAGAALAAYAARAGMESYVFCPDDAPDVIVAETGLFTPHVWRVNGLINELAPIVLGGKAALHWFDLSTMKEPYRIEGKKTMGLELAEQLDWEVPDVIFYPTGGGTGIIGMWKAFAELEAIGWIGRKRPRMVSVQATGCAPIVRAFEQGTEFAEPWKDAHTSVPGIRVPASVGDFLILRAIRESGGFAIAIADEEVEPARAELAASDGIHLCPEGAATLVAYRHALREGRVAKTERVVLFNCATGLKYDLPPVRRSLDRHQPIDYAAL
jgi:threonine synthase